MFLSRRIFAQQRQQVNLAVSVEPIGAGICERLRLRGTCLPHACTRRFCDLNTGNGTERGLEEFMRIVGALPFNFGIVARSFS